MPRYTPYNIYWGGELTFRDSCFEYDWSSASAKHKRIKVRSKPSYNDLVSWIRQAMELGNSDLVTQIVYKFPICADSSLSYTHMILSDDDGVQMIYDNLSNIQTYRDVELFVQSIRVSDNATTSNQFQVFDGIGSNYPPMSNYGSEVAGPSQQATTINMFPANSNVAFNQGSGIVESSYYGSSSSSQFLGDRLSEPSQYFQPTSGVGHNMFPNEGVRGRQYRTTIDNRSQDEQEIDPVIELGGDDNIESESDGDGEGESDFDYEQFSDREEDVEDTINVNESARLGEGSVPYDSRTMPQMCAVTEGMVGLNLAQSDVSGLHGIPSIAPLSSFVFPAPAYSMIGEDRSYGPVDDLEETDCIWDGVSELRKGLIFTGKAEVQAAVKRYSMKNNVSYSTVESQKHKLVLKCWQSEQNCSWWLRAMFRPKLGYWVISVYNGPHTCFGSGLTQDHNKLDSKLIGNAIMDMVAKCPSLSVAVIQANIKTVFEFQVSYKKAWFGKKKALELIFGNWEESYNKLPRYLNALKHYNPGCVSVIVTDEATNPHYQIFKRVFWSFKPCIEGFKHCRPTIMIDGTFLYGKYKHTLLVATAFDGNNHILPIAFAIVESENQSSWSWFMSSIRTYVTQRPGLGVISDRHAGILYAMSHPSLGWNEESSKHRFCLRHFVSNYNHKFHRVGIRKLLYRAAAQAQPRKFQKIMEAIREMDVNSYNWAMERPLEKWSLSHDNGARCGNLTTNIAECVNGVLKGIRQMPIQSIVEHTFAKMVYFFDLRRNEFGRMVNAGLTHTPVCKKLFDKYAARSNGHTVTAYDSRSKLCHVLTAYDPIKQKGANTQIVDLTGRKCSCNKFQNFRLPCSHAMAVCKRMHVDVWQYVDKAYSLAETLRVYDYPFQPLAHQDYWPECTTLKLVVDPSSKRKKGRPRSTRIRNEMDLIETGTTTYVCSICSEGGHNRNRCPQRPGNVGGQTTGESSRGRSVGESSRGRRRN